MKKQTIFALLNKSTMYKEKSHIFSPLWVALWKQARRIRFSVTALTGTFL